MAGSSGLLSCNMADRETFEAALKYALGKRGMVESFLKSKQRVALEALVRDKRDLLVILPTGYGKSLIYQLLPDMFNVIHGKVNSAVLVVSPLTAIMKEQKERLKTTGITATIVRHKDESRKENNAVCCEEKDFEMDSDFENASVLFAHPEVLTTSKGFREILLSDKFQESIVCVVADEAHCIVDWYVNYFLCLIKYCTSVGFRIVVDSFFFKSNKLPSLKLFKFKSLFVYLA